MRNLRSALTFAVVLVLVGAVALPGTGAAASRPRATGRSGTLLAGSARIPRSVDAGRAGRAQAFALTSRASGTARKAVVYVSAHSRARMLLAAIYAGGRSGPERRLRVGQLAHPHAGRWDTIGLRGLRIGRGHRYWLVVLGRGGSLRLRAKRGRCANGPVGRTGLRTLPTTWRAGHGRGWCAVAAYLAGPRGAQGESGAPTPPPPSTVAPLAPCTTTVGSMAALARTVSRAPGGSVICIAPGSYTGMDLSGAHSGAVTIQPEASLDPTSSGKVTIGLASNLTDGFGNAVAANIAPGSTNLVIRDLYFTNELSIAHGSSAITIDHNDFTQVGNGGGEMINFATSNCRAPNAPSWNGCSPLAPVSDVTISGNNFHGINSQGDDVLHTNNFVNLRITGNEISGAVENNAGGHVDCLQNVYGGTGLVFDHNYEHDNECQGFFLKDGDISNVMFDENLFVRDDLPATGGGSSYSSSQVINTTNFVAENNTIWDSKGLTLRCMSSSVACTAVIAHNVMYVFNNGNRGDATYFSVSGGDNIFATEGFGSAGPGNSVDSHPAFACGSQCDNHTLAGDGYRLTSASAGIDWSPNQYVYGPAA